VRRCCGTKYGFPIHCWGAKKGQSKAGGEPGPVGGRHQVRAKKMVERGGKKRKAGAAGVGRVGAAVKGGRGETGQKRTGAKPIKDAFGRKTTTSRPAEKGGKEISIQSKGSPLGNSQTRKKTGEGQAPGTTKSLSGT